MITIFCGMNISSKNPGAMVRFYTEVIGIPALANKSPEAGDVNYDGTEIGFDLMQTRIFIWDENKWGKSNTGTVTFVFKCDDIDVTYQNIKEKCADIDHPITTQYGGRELILKDPDGNKVLILPALPASIL